MPYIVVWVEGTKEITGPMCCKLNKNQFYPDSMFQMAQILTVRENFIRSRERIHAASARAANISFSLSSSFTSILDNDFTMPILVQVVCVLGLIIQIWVFMYNQAQDFLSG